MNAIQALYILIRTEDDIKKPETGYLELTYRRYAWINVFFKLYKQNKIHKNTIIYSVIVSFMLQMLGKKILTTK